MTDYEWLTQMGLCHKCRKEKTAPGKKFCFDCLDKTREYNRKHYNSEYAKMYQKRRRELYEEHKKAGICVRCNKKATNGLYCMECGIKTKRNRKKRSEASRIKRNERGLIPNERKKEGLCLWCGEKANLGKNCCEKHSKIFSESGKKARGKDKEVKTYWKIQALKNLESI